MSCAAAWSWGPPGSAHTAFGAEDAALIEADYLLHLFWGDDPEQKTETAWSKLPGDRIVDFSRMRQIRPDADHGAFDDVRRSADGSAAHAVVSTGVCQTATLQVRREAEAAAVSLVSPKPLCEACLRGDAHAVRMLLLQFSEFANAVVDEGSRATVLHVAASAGHLGVVKCLVACGAPLEAQTKGGAAPLHGAAARGQLPVLRFLLDAGASPLAATAEGATPLHCAAQHGQSAAAHCLISEAGVDPNVACPATGVTPLLLAAETGHTAVLRTLIDGGAHVNQRDSEGVTPVLAAAHFGRADAVHALLTAGALYEPIEVELPSASGLRPVFAAAQSGHTAVAKLLLQADAAPNPTYDDWEADEAANFNGHQDLALLLGETVVKDKPDLLLEQLAQMADGAHGMEGAEGQEEEEVGPKYRVAKRTAVSEGFDGSASSRVGWLEAGMVVQVATTIQGERGGAPETRMQIKHETVEGWVTCEGAGGSARLVPVDQPAEPPPASSGGFTAGLSGPAGGSAGDGSGGAGKSGGAEAQPGVVPSLRVSQSTFSEMGFSTQGAESSPLGASPRQRVVGGQAGSGSGAQKTSPVAGGALGPGHYRVLSKRTIRQSSGVKSKKRGTLAAGTLIKASELLEVTNQKGQAELRLQYPGGWVSVYGKDGQRALEPLETANPWETPLPDGRGSTHSAVAPRSASANGRAGSDASSQRGSDAGLSFSSEPRLSGAGSAVQLAGGRASAPRRAMSSTSSSSDASGFTVVRAAQTGVVASFARESAPPSLGRQSERSLPVSSSQPLGSMPQAAAPRPQGLTPSRSDSALGARLPAQAGASGAGGAGSAARAGGRAFILQLERNEWAPQGGALRVSASDLVSLGAEIGRQLGLADVRYQVFDDDFEEWCALGSLDDIAQPNAVRLAITAARRLPAGAGAGAGGGARVSGGGAAPQPAALTAEQQKRAVLGERARAMQQHAASLGAGSPSLQGRPPQRKPPTPGSRGATMGAAGARSSAPTAAGGSGAQGGSGAPLSAKEAWEARRALKQQQARAARSDGGGGR